MDSIGSMATSHDQPLRIIAVFKLVKGLLLLFVAIGALRLLHQDLAQVLARWLNELRIDPGNKYAAALFTKVGLINGRNLGLLGGLTFAYAALFLTEGVGLFLKKRWAEWLTVVSTGSFVPLEIYELCQQLSWFKAVLLLANVAIVAFLIWRLRQRRGKGRAEGE
jgi:uncharacterized membrane protein (DUF2068 family)